MADPFIETPFGRIELSFAAEQASVGGAPDAIARGAAGAAVYAWSRPPIEARLLVAPAAPELPPGLAVVACRVAVWEVCAQDAIGSCVFEARLAAGGTSPDGGPSGGQRLNALTWWDGPLTLALGAPDAEGLLLHYGAAGVVLPAAWQAAVDVPDPAATSIEEYTPTGLRLRLPGLRRGEVAYLHFAVAWAEGADHEDAPWFAVDLGPDVLRDFVERMSNESLQLTSARGAPAASEAPTPRARS